MARESHDSQRGAAGWLRPRSLMAARRWALVTFVTDAVPRAPILWAMTASAGYWFATCGFSASSGVRLNPNPSSAPMPICAKRKSAARRRRNPRENIVGWVQSIGARTGALKSARQAPITLSTRTRKLIAAQDIAPVQDSGRRAECCMDPVAVLVSALSKMFMRKLFR